MLIFLTLKHLVGRLLLITTVNEQLLGVPKFSVGTEEQVENMYTLLEEWGLNYFVVILYLQSLEGA